MKINHSFHHLHPQTYFEKKLPSVEDVSLNLVFEQLFCCLLISPDLFWFFSNL